MNRAIFPALAGAVLVLAGCASNTSTAQSASSPAASSAAPTVSAAASGHPVQGGDPASPQVLNFTCTLGWDYFSTSQGASTGTFHPGPAPSVNPTADAKPIDEWSVGIYNASGQPATFNWVQVTLYLNGKAVGGDTQQSGTSETLNPGQSDTANWVNEIQPLDEPPATNLDTGYQIENHPGASCAVTDWGNATGD
jgi:hypothetical protein